VERYVSNALGSTRSLDFLNLPPAGPYEVGYLISEYHQAQIRAARLVALAEQYTDANTDEVAALLNTGPAQLWADQSPADAHLALCEQSVPAYVGVKRRFKRRTPDTCARVDLTGRPTSEQ